MKHFKRLFLVLACFTLILCTGCKTETAYYFYTNVPSDGFEIADKNFVLGGIIEGYTPPEVEYPEEDVSNYTTMGYRFTAMLTDINLNVSYDFSKEGEKSRFSEFCRKIVDEMKRFDNAISTSVTYSDINKFNTAAAGDTVEITRTGYEILEIAKNLYSETEGYYNPALYYNIQAYGFGAAQAYPEKLSDLPNDEDVAKYTDLANHFADLKTECREVENANGNTEKKFYVTKPAYTVEVGGETLSMKIDLGGIGKGYAVDRAEEIFDEYGYNYGYFNFGFSSMMFKSFVNGGSYTVAFKNPRTLANDYYFTTPVRNTKLSTSGDNNQFYIIDGTRYCHIIDPTTGKPVQTGIMSVSVVGGSAAEDDAYTTAIMAMGKEKAQEFIKDKLSDRKVVFTCE